MKLGLLVVLVLAAVLPNLSESRIVSKCELKDKLAEAINKTRGPDEVTEEILAEIICEVNRRSNLNTSLVKTTDFRHPLTSNVTSGRRHKREASSRGRHHSEESDSHEENMIRERKTKKHHEHNSDEDSFESSEEVEEVSNSTAAPGNNRRKRGAHDNRRDHSGDVRGKGQGKKGHDSSESEDMSNEDSSESYETTAASASYGIFQLSDGYFCDSGNHLSRNLCQKSCTDFTDDDITDDIECFLTAFFDGYLRKSHSHQCEDEAGMFLQDCS
ncbi:PREDICTED: uncharacterized protein LOC106933634 isoform X2 [Poecilia mexicana]|uniref:uncharacterized protein LOC106933634 isoform X2 n=1 Tax=Poecilia mexicana TaxID=48701 RepID=UPI00072E64C8|nr:PREDICTED: uncharacterized protein LOC106933634 isoform X2 [Poecilia mexicana]